MMFRRASLLILLGAQVLSLCVRAQDDIDSPETLAQIQSETAEVPVVPPVRITFAPPVASGRFVVGVFDEKGFLVRTLMTDEDESVFDIGLNGFITTWDGMLADGSPAQPGRYNVRGYVVGGVEVEGVAYHFNDWVADGFMDWQVVADVMMVSSDRLFALVATDSVWTMVVTTMSGDVVWSLPMGEDVETAPIVQAGTRWVAARIGDHIDVYATQDGNSSGMISGIKSDQFSVHGDRLVVANGKSITEYQLPSGEVMHQWEVLSPIHRIVALDSGAAVVLKDELNEIVWTSPNDTQRVALDSGDELETLAASADGRGVWVAGVQGNRVTVREVEPGEGVVRELKLDPGEPVPVRISASGSRLSLLYAWDQSTRWTCLERSAVDDRGTSQAPATVDWTILADRRVIDAGNFGISSDGLVASGSDAALTDRVTVTLQPNPLHPDHPDQLVVEARVDDGRVWLTADNGLQLVPVSEPDGWTRVALVADSDSNRITLYQGNGWVVEEFQITGIDQISSFDGGSLLLASPKAEQPTTAPAAQ